MEQIFYHSSLPRAGSTLLQNIFCQNPDIYATPTSGLMELVYGARANYTNAPEFRAQDSNLMRKGFLAFAKSGMEAYCSAITDKKYFVDKSRSWGVHFDLLKTIHGKDPKIICMVRDPRDIFCSMEKMFRRNPDKAKSIIDWEQMRGTIIHKRIDIWANTPPIGLALERLQEIINVKNDHKMLFIRYEDLCLRPEAEMARIYGYLEIPYYRHNFDYIEQVTQEDDKIHGIDDFHTIRNQLGMLPSDAKDILGHDICEWIYNHYRWFFNYFRYQK